MNQQQFPNGSVYPPHYSHHHRLSFQHLPHGSQQHVVTTSAPVGSHTLPPISSTDYASSMGNDLLGSRAQPLQPSLMTAEPNPLGQTTATPVYGPTSTTFFTGPGPGSGPAPINAYSQAALNPQTYKTTTHHFTNPQAPHNSAFTSQPRSARLPDLRPMPINPMGHEHGNNHTSNGTPPGSASRLGDDGAQPIHVVGSQGRRGILPSAGGRPVAIGDDGTGNSRNIANPAKDANGKYPCEHCSKTYLHAKHLKRHMLRHTGVRPYTCGLCRDTFSRSDILKRHFQKCSARRGNPSGESHLTHSRANKKAKEEEASAAMKQEAPPADSAQPPSAFTASTYDNHTLDLKSLDLSVNFGDPLRPTMAPMSRSNSIKKAKTSRNSSHRGSLGTAPTSGYDPNITYSTGQITPDSITTSGAATPYTYPHETRPNQLSPDGPLNRPASGVSLPVTSNTRPGMISHYSTGSLPHIAGNANGRGPDMDWQAYQNFPSQEDFGNQQYPTGTMTPQQVKNELDFTSLNQNLFNFNK